MSTRTSPKSTDAGSKTVSPKTGLSPKAAEDTEHAEQPADVERPQIPYIERDDDDADSAFDDGASVASSTVSLTESIFDYRNIHGRTFQSSRTTEYWGPNDDRQNNGLDMAHHFIAMVQDDRLYDAPIPSTVSKILDVGTGTGIWAIDMADMFPAAEVIGTDISPIQPSWVPPNCMFHIEDAQLEWTYPPATFDFVHIRALYGSVADWLALYQEAYKALVPGGWFENLEFTVQLCSDVPKIRDDPEHIFKRWSKVFIEAADRMGRTLCIGNNGTMRKLMVEAGFVNVVHKSYQVPCGAWSSDPTMKTIGAYNLAFMEESLEGFALFMLKEVMGWEYAEVQVFVMEMRKAIRNPRIRPYYCLTNVFAQKPESAT